MKELILLLPGFFLARSLGLFLSMQWLKLGIKPHVGLAAEQAKASVCSSSMSSMAESGSKTCRKRELGLGLVVCSLILSKMNSEPDQRWKEARHRLEDQSEMC